MMSVQVRLRRDAFPAWSEPEVSAPVEIRVAQEISASVEGPVVDMLPSDAWPAVLKSAQDRLPSATSPARTDAAVSAPVAVRVVQETAASVDVPDVAIRARDAWPVEIRSVQVRLATEESPALRVPAVSAPVDVRVVQETVANVEGPGVVMLPTVAGP